MTDVTRIIADLQLGDTSAQARLLELVYDELRKLAARKMLHEAPGHTLDATALVHEAYLRLVDVPSAQSWNSRGHFFAAAAEAMRRILIESARRKGAVRRGGGRRRLGLSGVEAAAPAPCEDLLALDEALEKLQRKDPAKAELVKLRYFAGLTAEQAAEALGISTATAHRHWAYARAWLHQEVTGGEPPAAASADS